MKKFLVVLLSLGLIVAFAASASADTTNVKFQGAYYVAGVYDNNPTLTGIGGYSRAVFHQRFRLQPVFQVAEGLTFTARFDALEKHWGDLNWKGGFTADGDQTSSRKVNTTAATNTNLQESIEMERSYVTFKTAVGMFDIGYQNADGWGTQFCDAAVTRPRIMYTTAMGPLNLGLVYEKWFEADSSAAADTKVDADMDTYALFGIYKFKGGEAGLLYKYYYNAYTRTLATPYKQKLNQVSPYMKATFGPVYLEAEVNYWFGKATEFENPVAGVDDVKADTLTAYILAKMNVGPAYVGGQIGYLSGNDPSDATKNKEVQNKNTTWQPLLILGGSDRNDWLGGRGIGGGVAGNTLASTTNKGTNLTIGTIFAGMNPTPKLNVEAVIGYAYATKKPWRTPATPGVAGNPATEYLSDKIGTEIDLKATYKIYDNLSYYVAAGYLFSGDYWKRDSATAQVDNDYVLMNKLELTF